MSIKKINGITLSHIKMITTTSATSSKSFCEVNLLQDLAFTFTQEACVIDLTEINSANEFVIDLRDYSLLEKAHVLYPFVGGTSYSHSFNLIDTTKYRLSYSGGLTHSYTGIVANGTDGYYTCVGLTDSTIAGRDNRSMFIYSRTNKQETGFDFGTINTINATTINIRNTGDNLRVRSQCDNACAVANNNSRGFFGMSRGFRGTYSVFIQTNETVITEDSTSRDSVYQGFRTAGGTYFISREQGFVWVGTKLTTPEVINLYNSVVKFQTSLGRNV